MKKPEFLNTVTIGQTRQKYRDNVKALDNICLLVSTGSLEEVKEIAGESLINKVVTELLVQQEYIRNERKLTGDGTEELQILVSKEVVFCRGGQKL